MLDADAIQKIVDDLAELIVYQRSSGAMPWEITLVSHIHALLADRRDLSAEIHDLAHKRDVAEAMCHKLRRQLATQKVNR
jgi:hypothetical protein